MGFLGGLFGKVKKASAPKIAAPTTQDNVGSTINLNRTAPSTDLLVDPNDPNSGRGTLLGT
jgi:hypothetical protein